jgi:acetyl-CoA carboxylase, biotin carboxylase subunit
MGPSLSLRLVARGGKSCGNDMFKKILIANRGEIALRIIIACRELGIKTVAVYSEADENSLHVRFADEEVCIGPPRSTDSYLNVPAVISAADITGADAIHPGYGFLSESAYLAEVCQACQISFIGPDSNVIKLLGDKARARRAMKKVGLPMLPGSDGPVTSEDQALKVSNEIGYPVIIKAVAGGGGRGMRRVRLASELPDSLRTAQREAEAAFGNGDVYIEKYLEKPRHIEFQIIGDHYGNVLHLGARECSIQRRHQKLVEESPSPALTEKMSRRMGDLVVAAAKAVQYTNAGTFEFLMDEEGEFYYMETNTRLQVEHPVTEMVTGIDIVKEQIRTAAGERLLIKQSEVTFRGHSIECRVNAEDPETFAPSPGVIYAFNIPGGPGVRVDSLAHSECTISPYYDSMIAKIIVHGRDRQEAIARMRRTLEMTVIEGIKTSIPLHLKILSEPDFQAGRLDTSFMDRFIPKPKLETLAETA